jgi:hypothetical protein
MFDVCLSLNMDFNWQVFSSMVEDFKVSTTEFAASDAALKKSDNAIFSGIKKRGSQSDANLTIIEKVQSEELQASILLQENES